MENCTKFDPEEAIQGDLPVIDTSKKHLPSLTDAAWRALRASNKPFQYFLRSGVLTQINNDSDGTPVFRILNIDRLTAVMARAAHWEKRLKEGGSASVFPLPQVIRDMLASPDPGLPCVDAMAEIPVLTPQGKILFGNGYDPDSRIFLQSNIQIRPIPEQPSQKEIDEAVGWIQEPLMDFPFESDADKAHAIALLLLGFVRPFIKGSTPLHLLVAPTPGTGKSLLADVLLTPAHGSNKGVVTAANDDNEWRKRLSAQFREGRPVINIDNIKHPLDSGTLAAALTANTWEDRLLGSTEMIHVPVRCAWVATGNNVMLSSELARRTVLIRLDPKVETPEDREGFLIPNLPEWVRNHRGDLVWAALTLVNAWLQEGKPKPEVSPLGSFEEWSHTIGGILEIAGIDGFLKNRRELYAEADFEGQAWKAFVGAWWDQYSARTVKVSDLFEIANSIEGLPLGNGNEQARKTALGKRLASQRNRIIGGHRINRAGSGHGGSILWNILPVARPEFTPPTPPSYTEKEPEASSEGGVIVDFGGGPADPTSHPTSKKCWH